MAAWRGDILDISAIPELTGTRRTPEGWRIGPATTWAALLVEPLPGAFDGLRVSARAVGGPQVREIATIGGNILSDLGAADGLPALLTLDAILEFEDGTATARVTLQALCDGAARPAGLLTGILIPEGALTGRNHAIKLGPRRAMSPSWIHVAGRVEVKGSTIATARLAVAGLAGRAIRLVASEAELVGRPASAGAAPLTQAAFDDVVVREGGLPASYRRDAAATLVSRLCRHLVAADAR